MMKTKSKKLICLVLTFGLLLSAAACGSAQESSGESSSAASTEETQKASETASVPVESEPAVEPAEQTSAEAQETGEVSGSRILVVYFSRTGEQYAVGVIDKGNTEIMAEMIAEAAGAELFEVEPADDHYPMTYNELADVAKQEQSEDARPAYAGDVQDLSRYDTIFIGAPVWWGDWPMIMYTFFEENAAGLAGKTLVPFSTHEGSGLSGFDSKLASACSDSTVLDGLAIRGEDCQNDQDSVREAVGSWIAKLEF